MAQLITAPLERLRQALRRVTEAGVLREIGRIPVVRRDEIGELTNEFNHMLDVFEELAGAAQAVAAGDLDIEIGGAGDLQDSFRAMVARLSELVLQIREAALETGHPYIARSLMSLATVLEGMGRLDEARQRLERALELLKKSLGALHPQVAEAHVGLGTIWQRLGERERAVDHFEVAISTFDATDGPTSLTLVEPLERVAAIYSMQGRSSDATASLERALAIAERERDADVTARLSFALARALPPTDRARAVDYARRARDGWSDGKHLDEVRRVDRFLAGGR